MDLNNYILSVVFCHLLSKLCASMNISFIFLLISFLLTFSITLPYYHHNFDPVMVPMSIIGIVAFFFKVFTTFIVFTIPSIKAILNGIICGIITGFLFAILIIYRLRYYNELELEEEDVFIRRRMQHQRRVPRVRVPAAPPPRLEIPYYNIDESIRRILQDN